MSAELYILTSDNHGMVSCILESILMLCFMIKLCGVNTVVIFFSSSLLPHVGALPLRSIGLILISFLIEDGR
jgi:hypothetical protein